MRKKHSELLHSHHPGTGLWVLETAAFKEWNTGDKAILWCYGNRMHHLTVLKFVADCGMANLECFTYPLAGVGKTQITYVKRTETPEPVFFLYFF